ncbi:MAG: branched-chain amino acid ABC transporter permease [Candidatus Wallbacteria bacterium]|nr:branched-chain amino acid ABC transporter permease [Candidatus Wallbacteria bacterium]
MFELSNYHIQVLAFMGINIILAVSLNLINGFTGQFSLGHAGFMAIGAYTAAILTKACGWPFLAATLAGAMLAFLFGLLLGIPILRLKGDYLAIATFGLSEIVRVAIVNFDDVSMKLAGYVGMGDLWPKEITRGALGYPAIPEVKSLLWIYGWAFVTCLVLRNIVRSSEGRAISSIGEDELAAESLGINTARYKTLSFAIGAFFAGVAGALFAHWVTFIKADLFKIDKSIEILLMVVLGGMGSLSGSVLGAVVLTILPEYLRMFAQWRMVIYPVLLILLMLTRPEGLLGKRELSSVVAGLFTRARRPAAAAAT